MRIFILNLDKSVTAEESFDPHPYYINRNYPKGQIFREYLIGSAGYYWNVLHRDHRGNSPNWVVTETKYVPEEVLFARMLVD